jgi:26S proteasome regulatory subunit T4
MPSMKLILIFLKLIFAIRNNQPCIIFIDEIDAIGGRRFSEGSSSDREIQRTLMELLGQLDGFDDIGQVNKIS